MAASSVEQIFLAANRISPICHNALTEALLDGLKLIGREIRRIGLGTRSRQPTGSVPDESLVAKEQSHCRTPSH
jgi:hypothetical protein